MGVSTDGQICFGILFEEEYEFPWDNEENDKEIDSWWREINGYKAPFEPYTPEGEYAPGWGGDDPRLNEYFAHQRKWDETYPLPVELVNCCSGDYPIYILAVPGTLTRACRGSPEEINEKTIGGVSGIPEFKKFMEKWFPETKFKPKWWLSSYWG